MSRSTEPSELESFAASLGAVVLVGFPAAAVTAAGAASLASLAGVDASSLPTGSEDLLALAVVLFVGREAALARLHGVESLRRSTPGRNLARHAGLAVPLVAAVVHLAGLIVAGGTAASRGGTVGGVWPAVALGAVVLAGGAVAARAFVDGYRTETAT